MSNLGNLVYVESVNKSVPRYQSFGHRTQDAVNSYKRDAANDEWCDIYVFIPDNATTE